MEGPDYVLPMDSKVRESAATNSPTEAKIDHAVWATMNGFLCWIDWKARAVKERSPMRTIVHR